MRLAHSSAEARTAQSSGQSSGPSTNQSAARSGEQIVSQATTPVQSSMGSSAKRGEAVVQVEKETVNEKVPTIITGQQKLDVNQMKVEDFAALGLDRGSAESIVKYRKDHGLFHSAQDMSAVQGIRLNWLKKYSNRFAFVGVIEEVGSSVQSLKVGDRVGVPFNISCGSCFFCMKQLYGNCENTNPNSSMGTGFYGYSHTTGGYDGGQAEYVRAPFADVGPFNDTVVVFGACQSGRSRT